MDIISNSLSVFIPNRSPKNVVIGRMYYSGHDTEINYLSSRVRLKLSEKQLLLL